MVKVRPLAERNHPMAVAMEWVARVFASAVMMCAPGIGGVWLDRWLGTKFLGLAGFAVGLVGAMAYLIAVTKAADRKRRKKRRDTVHGDEGADEFR
jgi:hypothetical protein